jgi:maltose alpha-D-glucosyltransferase/alpha-amylase
MVALLGRRTAEMHLALAGEVQDPVWRPDEFSTLYQRSVYQSMRSRTRRVFMQVTENRSRLDPAVKAAVDRTLAMEKEILARMGRMVGPKLAAFKIRIHGDYHLGQVLFTGKDFVIIDFEGEPARNLSERRLKRSPLRDVAGMLRSFHYAAHSALRRQVAIRPGDAELLEPWLEFWHLYAGGAFLKAYRERMEGNPLIPPHAAELETMLRAFLLDKAVYELGYELNNRPDWLAIPVKGIEMLLRENGGKT